MDISELKNLDTSALRIEVELLKKDIFNLKLRLLTGEVKDLSEFKKMRKKIAQTLTILRQKQLSQ
jgi:ribosomal protein L29